MDSPADDLPVVVHVLEAVETGCARHLVDAVRHTEGFAHHVALPRERVGGVTAEHIFADLDAAAATTHIVDMRRSPTHPANLRAIGTVAELVRTTHTAVVHGHSSIGGVVARLAAWRTGRPAVYTPNGLAPGPLATTVERALGRRTAAFVAVSPGEAAEALRRRLVPPDRLVTVVNGIDPARPAPRSLRGLLNIPAGAPIVATMGRLSTQKASVEVVRHFARLGADGPRSRFVLIGDGPDRAAVEEAVAASGLGPRLDWLGSLPEAAAYLGDVDVFVLPSRYEGLPFALLEAMRAGVAVVATDVVGNRDVVTDGVDGLLVAVDDPSALDAAVNRLLGDAKLRARLGRAGAAHVRAAHDVTEMGRQLATVYRSVENGTRGRPTP